MTSSRIALESIFVADDQVISGKNSIISITGKTRHAVLKRLMFVIIFLNKRYLPQKVNVYICLNFKKTD